VAGRDVAVDRGCAVTDNNQGRAPLPPIKFDALAKELLQRAEALLEQWLPGGKRAGHEYQCGSVRGGEGSSCSVNINTGMWADFASGEKGGDLVSLYAASNDLSMGKAALQIARDYGLEDVAGVSRAREGDVPAERKPKPLPEPKAVKPASDESWAVMRPVPAHAPAPKFWHFKRNNDNNKDVIDHMAEYRVGGDLHGFVVRFLDSKGGKETLPHTWCVSARDGTARWKWKAFDAPKPLYFPSHALPNGRTVVLVEGEKKADALQKLLDITAPEIYTVASWAGGAKGWKKADWSWLKAATVLLWPDCDGKREELSKTEEAACLDAAAVDVAEAMKPLLPTHKQPGMAAMLGIGALLRDTHGCTVQMLKIPEPLEVPSGWDCGDAINTDGWDGERVLAFFGTAYALPPASGDKATVAASGAAAGGSGGDGGKKIAPSVSTGGDDDGGIPGASFLVGKREIPWFLGPYYDFEKSRWNTSRKMVITILEKDPVLEPILAYNELSNNVQSRELWPWAYSEKGDVTDAVDLLLGKYLTDTYGLPSIPRAALSEAIQTVAHSRRFHPIREYLDNLPVHDLDNDKSRIDNWLVYVLGESPQTLRPAMLEYLQIVGRCWLLGMVNRVMEPGCKFDYCPVLEGVGGLRKSTMVEVLASTPFFSDTPFEVGKGKEAQEQVQGLWLYEIAEMTHFSKSEVGAIKAFITSKVDRYRVAYGTIVGSFKRQCVLVGTTNENTYLRDRTGNRRFWPVPVKHVINTEWLIKFRDQLFAEAYALYKTGVAYTPTPEQERRLFEPMQESRLVETALMGELLTILTRDPGVSAMSQVVNNLTEFVTLAQLVKALETDAYKSSQVQESAVRGWLASEGWERKKKMVNNVRAWGYERPCNWPNTEVDDDMTGAPDAAQAPVAMIKKQDGDDAPF
jgi:putative DNA primase/helicase